MTVVRMEQNRFLKHFLPIQRLLRAYLFAATRDVHETDDLFQQVSNVLWEKFDRYDEARPFASWGLGIARVQVLKWRESRARSRKCLSGEALEAVADAAATLPVEPDERPTLLAECLQNLQPRARKAVELKYAGGQAIKQIAEHLGQQVGAVEMMLVRARRALRDCIERKLGRAERPDQPQKLNGT